MVHIMYIVYTTYIANGKDPTLACKMIVSRFTGVLHKWWTSTMTMEKWNLWENEKIKIKGVEESSLIGCITT